MNSTYTPPIKTNDKHAVALFRKAFPDSKLRKIYIQKIHLPRSLNSYWDSGHRDYFQIVEIATGKHIGKVPQNGTPYDGKNLELSELPIGYVLAVNCYAGTQMYGYLEFNEADLVKMIPTI